MNVNVQQKLCNATVTKEGHNILAESDSKEHDSGRDCGLATGGES